eukprot:TRINITY_DN145_c0_g1::TRINITY_DN145_c0_g1_i1::g.14444::m.14444 TRINITY_DN145_c0_g1::TRINITY_DN145_c0_g1_i1::g.14444  ORF type:complete len:110 (+),score=-18.97,DUF2593/PF10767.4/0.055 TRINITY_DN145_c0_g1_i1:789-1118(+)
MVVEILGEGRWLYLQLSVLITLLLSTIKLGKVPNEINLASIENRNTILLHLELQKPGSPGTKENLLAEFFIDMFESSRGVNIRQRGNLGVINTFSWPFGPVHMCSNLLI